MRRKAEVEDFLGFPCGRCSKYVKHPHCVGLDTKAGPFVHLCDDCYATWIALLEQQKKKRLEFAKSPVE